MLPHPVAAMTNHARWHEQELRAEAARERHLQIAAAAPRPPREPWWSRARARLRFRIAPPPAAVAPASVANR